MVDAARLWALLSRIRGRVTELRRYGGLDPSQYLADPQQVHASKYLLITAIEDALAAANHTIASEGYRAPSDYTDAFRSLDEAGVLPSDLAERLEGMARFRNLLVHQYAEVDDLRVHEFLQGDLGDLDRFAGFLLEAFPGLGEDDAR